MIIVDKVVLLALVVNKIVILMYHTGWYTHTRYLDTLFECTKGYEQVIFTSIIIIMKPALYFLVFPHYG